MFYSNIISKIHSSPITIYHFTHLLNGKDAEYRLHSAGTAEKVSNSALGATNIHIRSFLSAFWAQK